MGEKTLTQLREAVRFNLDAVKSSGVTNAQLDSWINFAYLWCTQPTVFEHVELNQRFGYRLVEGQDEYDISPTGLGAADLVPTQSSFIWYGMSHATYHESQTLPPERDRRRVDLEFVYGDQYMENITITPEGEPRRISYFDRTARLDRLPSGGEEGNVLMLAFWMQPLLLAADDDRTVLPPVWDYVIEARASGYGQHARGNAERGQWWDQEAGRMAADMTAVSELRVANTRNRSTVRIHQSMGPYRGIR